MANARCCDRCGAFYKENVRFVKTINFEPKTLTGICFRSTGGHSTEYTDLCDDCIEKLKSFLNGTELKEKKV